MSNPVEVLVVGELNIDMVLSGPGARPTFGQHEHLVDDCQVLLGSSSGITACGLARLGRSTAMVSVLGDDAFGRVVRDRLAECGVDTSAVIVGPELATGVTVILNPGDDRALLTHLGTIGLTAARHVPARLLAAARHLHVGCAYLQRTLLPELPDLLDSAHAHGLSTSLDPNFDPTEQWTQLLPVLPHLDLLLLNDTEAAGLTGEADPARAAALLRARLRPATGVAVVKLGIDGALAVGPGEQLERVPAVAVNAVDATGAGDSFDAGFVHARLGGAALGEALAVAALCGSLSTRGVGGTATQATPADLAAAGLAGVVTGRAAS